MAKDLPLDKERKTNLMSCLQIKNESEIKVNGGIQHLLTKPHVMGQNASIDLLVIGLVALVLEIREAVFEHKLYACGNGGRK